MRQRTWTREKKIGRAGRIRTSARTLEQTVDDRIEINVRGGVCHYVLAGCSSWECYLCVARGFGRVSSKQTSGCGVAAARG
jgi:hypothetical protein